MTGKIEALKGADPYDVCIIGSGPAGTVLGRTLAEKGVRTLILEAGEGLLRWFTDQRLKASAGYLVKGDCDYPTKHSRARALGGTSNFWTGRCTRFHPSDFAVHPYTPPENPWPISYAELEPYYEQAERTLRVRGGDFSTHIPARRGRFPLAPTTDYSGLKRLFAPLGVVCDDTPTATPAKAWRFFRVQKEILPAILAQPTATVVSGAVVSRLIADRDRRITAAEVRSPDGETGVARARVFVVACGGIETPRLLLSSRSEHFPEGIGNGSDQVGRYFNEHPAVNFYGRIRHSATTLAPSNKIVRCHQFYDEYRQEGLGSILLVFRQSWLLPHHNMPFKAGNIPRKTLEILGRVRRPTLYMGATIEMKLSPDNRVTLAEERDPYGQPMAQLTLNYSEEDHRTLDRCREIIQGLYRRLEATGVYEAPVSWSRHHQSTCRMGDDPRSSVTDRHLRVHETPNLYLCGSEVFVTGGAIQPCLTIVALAHRLGDHLVERLARTGA